MSENRSINKQGLQKLHFTNIRCCDKMEVCTNSPLHLQLFNAHRLIGRIQLLSIPPLCTILYTLFVYAYLRMLSPVLFATPWSEACQIALSMKFSRQECWTRLPFPAQGDLCNPGIKLVSLASPALAGGFFTTVPLGKPLLQKLQVYNTKVLIHLQLIIKY